MASANVPLTPAHRRLLSLLHGFGPSQTICLADMTNTLLRQSFDGSGYPEEAKRLHREYLAQGGALVIVTDDSQVVVREQFLDPLAVAGGDLFEDEKTSFVHLVEQHVAGAMFVFEVLARDDTP